MKSKNNIVKINKSIILAIVFLFVVTIAKMVYVSISHRDSSINLKEFAASRDTVKRTLYAERGKIYDSLGELLAQNSNSYTVIAFLSPSRTTNEKKPQHVVDKDKTAELIAPIINMTKEDVLKLLNQKNLYQVELGPGGRGITELTKDQIKKLNLPGISFISSSKRYYAMGNFASYIIGYAKKNEDSEIIGEMGIEKYYDKYLKGQNGYQEFQKDAYGYQIPNTPSITEEPQSGYNIYLTIDNNIQLKVENAVRKITEESTSLEWLTISVADAKTGAILGSASSPSFNPNYLNISSYLTPLTQYAYEPGSTMKVFSFMAAIENGLYQGDEIYTSGKLKIGDLYVTDSNNVGWGDITFDEGFSYSSNVAASKLAQKLGRTKLKAFYEKLGFGSKTGIELPESAGRIAFKYDIEVANSAFGQGILTTPIQNIQALTILANDGVMVKPYIIDKIVNPTTGEIVSEGKRTEVAKVASHDTIEKMQELMYDAVYSNKTTASNFIPTNIEIIGKTGTAQIASPKGGYLTGKNDYIRSFAALFPNDDPQYIVYFSIKQLVGSLRKAGKNVAQLMDDVAVYKNIKKTDTATSVKIITENYINKKTVDVVEKLKQIGLKPIVIGDGNVVINQFPSKNTYVIDDSKVLLATNSENITMPDITKWSLNEIKNYCLITKLSCNYEGYGYVKDFNILVGQKIKSGDELNIILENIYSEYYDNVSDDTE